MHLPRRAIDQADAVHRHASHDVQVGSAQVGREVGLGGAEALARLLRDLVQAHAFLCGAIEVGGEGQARLHTRFDKAFGKRIGALQVGHVQGAVLAVPFVVDALVVLGLQKVGQDLGPRPPRTTLFSPVVVIGLLAPDVGHCIGRAGAAQGAPTRLKTNAAVQAGLRHGAQALRDDFGARHEGDARGAVDQRAGVGRPSFDQGHLHSRVFAQTGCQHTPGRATPHDHVVKVHEIPPSKCFVRPI